MRSAEDKIVEDKPEEKKRGGRGVTTREREAGKSLMVRREYP